MILSNIFSMATFFSVQGSEKLPEIAKKLAPFVQGTLKWFRGQYEIALYVSTVLVAVGVILEGFEVIHQYREKIGPYKIHPPDLPRWMVRAAFWGWLFVSVGVAGEFVFESWVSTKNEELEGISNLLLGDAQLSAAEANREAGNAATNAPGRNSLWVPPKLMHNAHSRARTSQETPPRKFSTSKQSCAPTS